MSGNQQTLSLTSVYASYGAATEAGAWDVLLRFPLPGATTGNCPYVVYLRVPDPGKRRQVEYTLGTTAAARGFFYQAYGEGRGREIITGGSVRIRRTLSGSWTVALKAECQLGTRLEGAATLKRNDFSVRDYLEQRHDGDVADLVKARATSRPVAPTTGKAKP